MENPPEIVAKAMRERSSRAPLAFREDPDFGKLWLVWSNEDDGNIPADGYPDHVEWLSEIEIQGHPSALLIVEWRDHDEKTWEEFSSLCAHLPVEVSDDARALYRRALLNLPRLFDQVQAALKANRITDEADVLRLTEAWLLGDELTVVCHGSSVSVDCFVKNTALELHVIRTFRW